MDHTTVLQQAANSNKANISVTEIMSALNWEEERTQKALNYMVREGLAWIDLQGAQEKLYWFPSMFSDCIASN